MRIGLVLVSQESNTFNPSFTTIERFAAYGIRRGRELLEHTDHGISGHVEAVAERDDVETVPIFGTRTVAGGRVSAEALEFLVGEVVAGLRAAGPLDGLALQLHGGCSAEGVDDFEGHMLAAIRSVVGPDLPIGLALDHHANITREMVDLATVIVGHRTQPHDLHDTGLLNSRLLFRVVAGEVDPVMTWRKLPLLSHQEQYLSDRPPMSIWFERAREAEREDDRVLAASPFPMQPWLDIDQGGWSVVVVTDDEPEMAEELADELADLAWSLRDRFQVKTSVPVDEAVARAAATDGLVVLSDTGDSVRGGAGGDSTVIIREALRQGAEGLLVQVVQPDIGELLAGYSVDDEVTVTIGGAVAHMHEPITLTGTLLRFEPTTIRLGGDYAHPVADLGWTAVLEVPCGHVVVTERTGIGGVHPDMYPQVGLDPLEHSMAVVKTASNFQYFRPIASDLIRVDTPGPSQSDIAGLTWSRVPRPIYPLDPIEDRHAAE
ncbi:MAG TPA: M81 family metallopeptidase [Acidimicrobiia bacterium]|nr:M81 family metallopeptidase [Acidimicrobiia bacterium]